MRRGERKTKQGHFISQSDQKCIQADERTDGQGDLGRAVGGAG